MTRRELLEEGVREGRVQRGIITGFRGSWGSGLGFLEIDGVGVPCDNAPTVRALDAAFGDAIGPGHTVNATGGFIGKEIYYSMDDMGLVLEAFTPTDDPSLDEEVEEG